MLFILLLTFVLLLIVLVLVVTYFNNRAPPLNLTVQERIYCLMVTGKDNTRVEMARYAVNNFNEQSHPNKTLVIINHHPAAKVLTTASTNIYEYRVLKENLTLGELRNISLELVPRNAFFVTWDDDDYRDPSYLATLYAAAEREQADCVAIQNRYEVNVQNGYAWRSKLKNGFVHFLGRNHPEIRYLARDSMEDLEMIHNYEKQYKLVRLDNNPIMYIRTVHGANTSLYVDANKSTIQNGQGFEWVYKEFQVDRESANKLLLLLKQKLNVTVPS